MRKEARALTRTDILFKDCETKECVEKTKDMLHAEFSINQLDKEIIEYMFSKAEEKLKQLGE